MDLALNNLQRLICHKTNKPNQTIYGLSLLSGPQDSVSKVLMYLRACLLTCTRVLIYRIGYVLWHINPDRLFNVKSC